MGYDTYFDLALVFKKPITKKKLRTFFDKQSIFEHLDLDKNTLTMGESFRSGGADEVIAVCARLAASGLLKEEDSYVHASGEETGDIWRIRFKDGKSIEEHALADVYNLWDEFFSRYGDKLPKALKEELEEFRRRFEFAESV